MSSRTTNGRRNGAMTRRNTGAVSRDPGAGLTGTGISFTAAGTISDSGNGLAIFAAGQRIEVRGSPLNSGQFNVVTSAAGALTVLPGTITSSSAGASITISSVEG